MKGRKRFWKNNEGLSLILVIGCVALLSVTGSMLLVVTTNNREMKELEKRMQDTFYQAESGSDEMVSALEAISEEILEDAFSDMLIQYSEFAGNDERGQRIADYFTAALKNRLSAGGAAIMNDAVGATLTDVVFSGGVSEEVSAEDRKTNTIRLSDVIFTYKDGEGNESKITTDICIQAEIPDIESGLNASGMKSEFTDFALITKGDVAMQTAAGTQTATIDGNMYAGGDVKVNVEATLNLKNADKVLVKKDIIAEKGTIKIDNTGKISNGAGVWADGLKVLERGTLDARSNFYISDDLTVEESGGKVILGGADTEYIGFSGNTTGDPSKRNSAVTINNAKDILLDFSALKNLVLSGNSYIQDKKWGAGSSVMQGESIGYKDMQAMYLVPGECLSTGINPMPKDDYYEGVVKDVLSFSYEVEDPATGAVETFEFNLEPYLDPVNKYVRRNVVLDGGATEFTYLYLNFVNEAAAVKYVNDYMATPYGAAIKEQIANLGASEIKLAQNNYTLGNTIEYIGGSLSMAAPNTASGAEVFRMRSTSTAKQRQKALFTSFRLSSNGTIGSDWTSYDVVGKTILDEAALSSLPANVWTKARYGAYDFWVYNGDVTIPNVSITGIILVNGKVTFQGTTGNVNGLVIATDGCEFTSTTTLTANQEAVEALLREPEVAKYFRVNAGAAADGSYGYLSSEAVNVSFENWQKN